MKYLWKLFDGILDGQSCIENYILIKLHFVINYLLVCHFNPFHPMSFFVMTLIKGNNFFG